MALFIAYTFAMLLGLSACTSSGSAKNIASGKTYDVTPELREFYNVLGDESLLGPAISEKFAYQSFECQYTASALLCLNPMVNGEGRFSLFPLGISLNLQEVPVNDPKASGPRVVNGFTIYEEFVPLFDQFSDQTYAGNPISEVHLNYAQQRIEQFFENIGFYRKFSDPPGTVKLLAYGVAGCVDKCSFKPITDSILLNSGKSVSNASFLDGLGGVTDSSVFGSALTQPYTAEDGLQEQVYDKVVLFSPSGGTTNIKLRPISLTLKMLTTEPGPKVYGNENGMVFYAVKGDQGYHVPIIFDEFISTHGGTRISGNPIAEVIEYQPGIYRQCFENYCLDYLSTSPQGQQVQLADLGKQYLDQLQSSINLDQPEMISPETVSLSVSAQYQQLSSTNPQKLDLQVLNRNDGQPMNGLESELSLSLPDGSQYLADLPATQNDGRASVIIPSMGNIPNGTILHFEICLKTATSTPVCVSGSYLIWNE
jgi:hypothetical protein